MPVIDHLNHVPDAEGIAKIEQVRSWVIKLEGVMGAMVPESRELAIAMTKLEEARMWAIKGIVMQYPCNLLSPETVNDTNPAFSEQRQAEGLHPAPTDTPEPELLDDGSNVAYSDGEPILDDVELDELYNPIVHTDPVPDEPFDSTTLV